MIELLPLRQEHLELIEPDPFFADVKTGMKLAPLLTMGNGVSLIDMDRAEILACYGYVWKRANVYWMWILPSARGSRNLIRLMRHFERWVTTLPARTRIECTVKADFEAGIRFVKALKFEQETPEDEPARKYDGRNDHHLFARCVGAEAIRNHSRELLQDFVLLSAGRGVHDLQLRGGNGRICPL
jgi:hypothetical protein